MSMIMGLDMGRILLDLSDDAIQRLDNLKQLRNLPWMEVMVGAKKTSAGSQNPSCYGGF